MRAALLVFCLLAAPAFAEHPWEMRIDLNVPVPIELPAVPATNPFATTLAIQPVLLQSPLRARFEVTEPAEAAAYIDADGSCRRVVFTRLALPGLTAGLEESLTEAEFTPGRRLGAATPTWAPVVIALRGRIDRGTVVRLAATPADPAAPPVPEAPATPAVDPRDAQLPGIPVEQLDQLPVAKRFRAKVSGQTFRQPLSVMVEVGPDGRARRAVFLACPDGLRDWVLTSAAEWRFQPGQDGTGPVAAWTRVEGEVEVEMGTLRTDSLRITRAGSYPPAAPAPGAGRPPGA